MDPKVFRFDTGVARAAGGLARDQVDPAWRGFAFEVPMLPIGMQLFGAV